MLDFSRMKTLRKANKNVSYNLTDTKFSNLTPVDKNIYIIIMQFENAFHEYSLRELVRFTNLNKEQILETIETLHDKNVLDKNDLNLKK